MLFSFWGCISSSLDDLDTWTWVSIDPHVHSSLGSNDTDGLGTPENIVTALDKFDLDVVFLTDHSNSLGSMDCVDVEDCPNQGPELTTGDWPENVLLAAEISPRAEEDDLLTPTGHIGCLPKTRGHWNTDVFIDRPFGTISGASAIEQCHDAGGWAILNHPFGPAPWVAFDQSSLAFDAVEVFNGGAGFDPSDEQALDFWEEGIMNGQRWVPIGASDCHRWMIEPPGTTLDPALGWPRTNVGKKGEESLEESLFAGRVILFDPSTQLDYWMEGESGRAGPSEHIQGPALLHVHAHTTEKDLWLSVKNDSGVLLHEEELRDTVDVQLKVEKGAYWVRILPKEAALNVRGVALGMPIWVE